MQELLLKYFKVHHFEDWLLIWQTLGRKTVNIWMVLFYFYKSLGHLQETTLAYHICTVVHFKCIAIYMSPNLNTSTRRSTWMAVAIAMFIIPTFRLMSHPNMLISNSVVLWVHYCILQNGLKLWDLFFCLITDKCSLIFFYHLLSIFKFTKKVDPINISDHVLMFTDVLW